MSGEDLTTELAPGLRAQDLALRQLVVVVRRNEKPDQPHHRPVAQRDLLVEVARGWGHFMHGVHGPPSYKPAVRNPRLATFGHIPFLRK